MIKMFAQMLYADAPVDTSLYALYLHHNYTKFCETEEQCGAICDYLSATDMNATSGENAVRWYNSSYIQTDVF
jgi:cell cycle checkpoint protein